MASGKMTSNMAKALKPGPTTPDMKALTTRARNMERGLFALQTEASIQVISSTMKYQAKENTYGQTVNLMKANGTRIKCMGMGF